MSPEYGRPVRACPEPCTVRDSASLLEPKSEGSALGWLSPPIVAEVIRLGFDLSFMIQLHAPRSGQPFTPGLENKALFPNGNREETSFDVQHAV